MFMSQSRREFVAVSLTVAVGAAMGGCQSDGAVPEAAKGKVLGGPVDAGPASDYAADGVYAAHREQGFFLVRTGGELLAISSICTHRNCIVEAEKEGGFACPCHGANFDALGHVTQGPALKNLPRLTITRAANGHLRIEK